MSHTAPLALTAVQVQPGDRIDAAPWLTVAPGFDFVIDAPIWLEVTAVSRRGKYIPKGATEPCFDHVVLRTPAGAVPAGIKEKHRFKLAADTAIDVQRVEAEEAPAEAPVAPAEPEQPEPEPVAEAEPAAEPAAELEPEADEPEFEEFEPEFDADLEEPEFDELPDLEEEFAAEFEAEAVAPLEDEDLGWWAALLPKPGTELTA